MPRRQSRRGLSKVNRYAYLFVLTGLTGLAGAPMKWTRPFEWNRASAVPAGSRRLPSAHHYFAFLSYSHADREEADWLHQELEGFRVPASLAGRLTANGVVPKRLTPIFRDEQELAAAHDLNEEIREALEASRCLIVLCSPAAARSKWTNAEIDTFKRIHPEGCIIAAVIAGEPLASDIPGREEEECFPPALVAKYNRRGKPTGKKTEPLAADLREGKGGRRIGFLKIVAGVLGVGLDDLVQRDTTRRQRRLAWLTAASLGGMAVTSGLAVTAIQARDSAREQRREAEGLVEFMLGDLRSKLEPIGRLDALDGVGSRVLAYYKKQDASELSDAALLQRSRALNLMAEVAYMRGNMAEADGLYRQAKAGTEEAVRRSPDDPNRIFDLAQNVFWLGELARFRGDADAALANYTEYKSMGDRLVSLQPDNLKWRMEALYGVEDVGIALYNKRRFADAARQFSSSLGPMQSLVSVDPTNEIYQSELPKLFAWLADAERSLGNLDAAIVARQKQIALLDAAISRGASDVDFRAQLIVAHQGLANLLIAHGDPEHAIAEFQAAVGQGRQLMPVEPTNKLWKSATAGAGLDFARALLSQGRTAEAAEEAQSACALVGALNGRNPTTPKLTTCLKIRARLVLAARDYSQASELAQRALASARTERSEDPVASRYGIASAYRLLGDVRHAMGDEGGANEAWSNALSAIPRVAAETPPEIDEHAVILQRLGRAAEAQQIASRLAAIGYRRMA